MKKDQLCNIGKKERNMRLIAGFVMLGFAVYLSYSVMNNNSLLWTLLLFIVTYQGVRFIFDFQTGICPLKAELGQQRMRGFMTVFGDKINDPQKEKEIRSVSRRALVISIGIAFIVAGISYLF